ncbi:hypothetical protein ACJJTC_005098 [Scirpophaga incertulas]
MPQVENVIYIYSTTPALGVSRIKLSANTGEHVDKTASYECADCDISDVICNGQSTLPASRITIVKSQKKISISFPSFEDNNTCVYIAIFKKDDKSHMNIIAVIDTVVVPDPVIQGNPEIGAQFEVEIPMSCDACIVERILFNGILMETEPTRRSGQGPVVYYSVSPSSIAIHISQFASMYEGVYQATFDVKGEKVTKTILELGKGATNPGPSGGDQTAEAATAAAGTTDSAAKTGSTDVSTQTKTGDAETSQAPGGATTDVSTSDPAAGEKTAAPSEKPAPTTE